MGGRAGHRKQPRTRDDAGLPARDAARLATLQAAGLFVDLDRVRIAALTTARAADGAPLALAGRHALRDVVEAHLRAGYGCPRPRDVVVESPQSVDHLRAAITVELAGILEPDPDPRLVHVRAPGTAPVIYRPRTHHEWAAVFNAALAAAGEHRQLVSFDTLDWEEPLYVLVTPAQADTLATARLLAHDSGDIALPAALPVTSRAVELAELLGHKGVVARAQANGEIVLELDLARANELLARLRAALHHQERVTALVQREYGPGRRS